MAKLLATLTVLVAAFMLALVIPLYASGHLNKESIDRILGREAKLDVIEEDPASPLVATLNAERTRLEELDAKLAKRKELLDLRESELSATLTEVKSIQDAIAKSMDEMDAMQSEGMTQVAESLATMDAANAAIDLESMTPEQAASLLPMIDERARGGILDEMTDTQHRALIFQIMQESKY